MPPVAPCCWSMFRPCQTHYSALLQPLESSRRQRWLSGAIPDHDVSLQEKPARWCIGAVADTLACEARVSISKTSVQRFDSVVHPADQGLDAKPFRAEPQPCGAMRATVTHPNFVECAMGMGTKSVGWQHQKIRPRNASTGLGHVSTAQLERL